MTMIHSLFRPLALLFCILLSLSGRAYAADTAGQVIMATGQVTALAADGTQRSLQRRSAIAVTDTIITGPGSRVQIRFIDNALLALQENSRLNIHEYRFAQSGQESGKVLMELVEGGFRTLTGSIGKGNQAAYQVTTPVASIGIRGTLYSALLQGNQLFTGVWQGGISLTLADGQSIGLGGDSSFSFGRIGPDGFQGLLQPPRELDPAPAGGDQASDDSTDTAELPGPGKDGNPHSDTLPSDLNGAAIPTPFDRLTPDEIAQKVRDPRFSSTGEYSRYLSSAEVVSMTVGDQLFTGKVFMDDNERAVFVTEQDGGMVFYRYDGEITYPGVSAGPVDLPGISWGVWGAPSETNPATPVSVYPTPSSTGSALEQPVYWVTATPLQLTDPTTDQYSFEYTNYNFGSDSFGNTLQSISSSFTLDLEDGAISNGNFYASYASVSESESSSSWSFSFTGQLNPDATLNFVIDPENTFVNIYQNFTEYSGSLNIDNSDLSGFLTGTDNTPGGAVTQHYLKADITDPQTQETQSIWANGVLIWTATPNVGEIVTGP